MTHFVFGLKHFHGPLRRDPRQRLPGARTGKVSPILPVDSTAQELSSEAVQRSASGAAESGSDGGADAVSRRLQAIVRRWDVLSAIRRLLICFRWRQQRELPLQLLKQPRIPYYLSQTLCQPCTACQPGLKSIERPSQV
jgi:hypothetical protein